MDLGLKDKVALVAAASKGIGRAIAHELAAEGAPVAICARDEATLAKTGREIAEATGATVLANPADVSRLKDIGKFVDAVLARFARVDILVTNSGGPPSGSFDTLDMDAWEKASPLSLVPPGEVSRRALPGTPA